jgi:hypothetical protein
VRYARGHHCFHGHVKEYIGAKGCQILGTGFEHLLHSAIYIGVLNVGITKPRENVTTITLNIGGT